MKYYGIGGRGGLKPLARKLHNMIHLVYPNKNKKPNHNIGFVEVMIAYFDKRLDEIEELIKHIETKKKKEPSDYNLFIAKARAEGKSFLEALEAYKKNRD